MPLDNLKPKKAEKRVAPVPKTVKVPKVIFSEDFWESWNILKPSVESVFRASKWGSMNGHWKIVKRNIEVYKK